MKSKFSLMLFALLLACLFYACAKQETAVKPSAETGMKYFSDADISDLKNWFLSQKEVEPKKIRWDNFPDVKFNGEPSRSDSARLQFYKNGLLYANDDTRHGKKADYNRIVDMIIQDKQLDKNGKIYLLSLVQLFVEVYGAPEVVKHLNTLEQKARLRTDPCNCSPYNILYLYNSAQCSYYGNIYGNCTQASAYLTLYYECTGQTPTCPYGFTFDGANCYSGVHFPSGYTGFALGNGFYTQQNCSISTANNCCPSGFAFDGANCHYWELYFPSEFEPFVLNNTFYVKPICE